MIARIWRGWTTKAMADEYEHLLKSEVFPGIVAKRVRGFIRLELGRRELAEETEFVTVMWFDSPEAITAFAGPDPEAAYVPDAARRILKRFDARSAHYDIRGGVAGPATPPPPAAIRS